MLFLSLFPEFSGQEHGFESLKLEEEPAALPKVREICYSLITTTKWINIIIGNIEGSDQIDQDQIVGSRVKHRNSFSCLARFLYLV